MTTTSKSLALTDDRVIDRMQSRTQPMWIDRLARHAVLSRLSRLHGGTVEIADSSGVRVIGQHHDADAEPLRARVTIHDHRFWRYAMMGGSLGVAEAYLNGAWSCDDLTALLRVFVRDMSTSDDMDRGWARVRRPLLRAAHWMRRNHRAGSRKNIHEHYDLGNDFFALMLDATMTYSCALFESPETTLEQAQVAKLDRLCHALNLQTSDHLLEIGTGWGSCAMHAASRYGCHVTTITISRQQHDLARERIRQAGLEDRIEVLLCDYRDLRGAYDKIVSIEMIEAVGHEFLPTFFAACASLLKRGGCMALQAITMPDDRYKQYRKSADFIQRYVFPGSCCPSIAAMQQAMNAGVSGRSVLNIESLDSIGLHYVRTLRAWRNNFMANLPSVRRMGYSERFIRMWHYYLCYCEAGFAERYIDDVQMILRRN